MAAEVPPQPQAVSIGPAPRPGVAKRMHQDELIARPPGVKVPGKKQKLDPSEPWARKQAEDVSKLKWQQMEGNNEYNVWYHKFIGDNDKVKAKAAGRCRPLIDSGKTKGMKIHGRPYHCVHFARGTCMKGPECMYLHRLPTLDDEKTLDILHDVFGRQRHATDKEDMDGVGCFNRQCKTLYVTGMQGIGRPDAQEILARHFAEWGPLDRVDVKPRFGCAFIKYKWRVSAEFAREAMAEQSLDRDEQLTLRWAYDDPNPKAIERDHDDLQDELVERMAEKGIVVDGPLPKYHTPDGYLPPQNNEYHGEDVQSYPLTDSQYTEAWWAAYYAAQAAGQVDEANGMLPDGSLAAPPNVDPNAALAMYTAAGQYVYYDPQAHAVALTIQNGPMTPEQQGVMDRERQTREAVDRMNALLDKIDSKS